MTENLAAVNLRAEENTHDLYRHFDAQGNLLYVGISFCAVLRLSQHRKQSGWYGDIARVEIEKFPTRSAVMRAERKAIRTENPLHNIHLVKQPEESNTHGLSDLAHTSDEILMAERVSTTYSILSRQHWYDPKEAAGILGIRERSVISEFECGRLGGFTWLKKYTVTQGPNKGEERKMPRYKFSSWQLIEYLEHIHIAAEQRRKLREK